MDIQTRLFDQIRSKLPPDAPLGKALMEDLDLSRDSAYRRARGETSLTPEEIQALCLKYEISFDRILGVEGKAVTFQYNPLQRSEFSFETYLKGINDGFTRMMSQRSQILYYSSLDMIIFQVFNFPALTRFKLLYFAKTYLKIPRWEEEKFHRGWTGNISTELIADSLHKYVRVPSTEVIDYECAKGLIREIVSFWELGHIASREDALFLLDEVEKLMEHFRDQIRDGRKSEFGKPVITEADSYSVNMHETYLQDNTFIAETNAYRMLYITHNMMNYLYTVDVDYVNRSYHVFQTMLKNCKSLKDNQSVCLSYFSNIQQFIAKARMRIGGMDLL